MFRWAKIKSATKHLEMMNIIISSQKQAVTLDVKLNGINTFALLAS